jgi:hypothetical protein
MAKGPFGNPLSTGIALSGVIDMVTPVRQAQERKRKRQAEEKVEQDNRAKELGAIMGKIAIDEDKIWWRYHDDARLQYADTIDKVQQMYSAGDYAGMYKTVNQFDTKMANYIQATNQKNARVEELKKGGYYMDSNLESMRENRDVDNAEYAKYLQETGYGTLGQEGIFSYMPNAKMFDIKDAWDRNVKGEEKHFITEPGKGYKQVGTTPTGVIAETDYAPEILSTAQQRILSELYADPYRAARILEKEGYDVKSLESIADPQQKAIRTKEMFDDYIMRNKPGVGQKLLSTWKPESKTGGEKTFEEKYKVVKEPTFVDIEVDQNSGIPANSKLIGIPFNAQHDINATKWDYRKTIEISDGSYQMVGGRPIQKPASRGPGVKETGAVPMGLYALKGPSDKRVYAGYLFKRKLENGPEVNVMHYQPLDANSLDQQYVREFIDASGISVDDYIEYYDIVAKKSGFPVSSYGGSSTTGTGSQSSKSSSSSVSISSSDIQKMLGMNHDDFNKASNQAWVDEIGKKIRSMSNIDDLWKQTGKRGILSGLNNAELLSGFVESRKTDLLTGTQPSASNGANTPSFR